MASIRVIHTIDDLADDLRGIAVNSQDDMSRTVRKNVDEGVVVAKQFARFGAGTHGKNYYKRISGEMTGLLSGEFGPEGTPKTEFVGVGFRSGNNLDLPRTADLIGPKFAHDVESLAEKWFW